MGVIRQSASTGTRVTQSLSVDRQSLLSLYLLEEFIPTATA